jgi:hypothetical protein
MFGPNQEGIGLRRARAAEEDGPPQHNKAILSVRNEGKVPGGY